jgi:hypothetical protein
MKKYLMMGMAAVAFASVLSSCSKEDSVEHKSQIEINKLNYELAFVNRFCKNGPIAPNQTWGFGAKTRGVTKEDHEIAALGLTKPTLKPGEAQYVMEWFGKEENQGAHSETIDCTKFWILWVGKNQSVNVKHHQWDQNYYNNNKNNGATSNFSDRIQRENVVLDQLWIDGEHILDWNGNDGKTEWITDHAVQNITAHNSYVDAWTTEWKLAEIDVPGVGKGWYVGLTAYGEKTINGGHHTLLEPGQPGYDPDQTDDAKDFTDYDRAEYFENYVFKIVPGDGGIDKEYVDRVICEDLGAADDFDFNDVVFDVRYADGGAYVKIRNIGGVLPLYVGDMDHEVHEVCGATATNGRYSIMGRVNPDEFFVSGAGAAADIRIYVDGSSLNSEAADQTGKDIIELRATMGEAPQKICVTPNFQWCAERQSIEDKYENFSAFVSDPNVGWY